MSDSLPSITGASRLVHVERQGPPATQCCLQNVAVRIGLVVAGLLIASVAIGLSLYFHGHTYFYIPFAIGGGLAVAYILAEVARHCKAEERSLPHTPEITSPLNGPVDIGFHIQVVQGDILDQPVQAIVNAANPTVEGGGGIDGAIHRAAGPQLKEACQRVKTNLNIAEVQRGQAIITPSFNIRTHNPNITHVIHAVGPQCDPSRLPDFNQTKQLQTAYTSALRLANQQGIRSIAFPAISTGVYGFPFVVAQDLAYNAITDYCKMLPNTFDRIYLVYYTEADYQSALNTLHSQRQAPQE